MDDQSTAAAPQHFILLTRSGEEGTPEFDAWNSELPTLAPAIRVGFGNIRDAVEDARGAAVERVENERNLKLKVAEGTSVDAGDVLELIQANGGPQGLDLSYCKMAGIDLSLETIMKARDRYLQEKGAEPLWVPDYDAPIDRPLYLGGARLRQVDLTDARLTGAEMMGTDLTDARLIRADLSQAVLNFASIRGARFEEANLTQAQLDETDGRRASFRRASLEGAQFNFADLTGANFDEALLHGAAFAWAELVGARMMAAQLKKANLYGAHFGDNFLLETDFDGADFTLARLQQVDLYRVASLVGARWYGAFLDRTRMRQKHLGKAIGDEIEAHKVKTAEAYRKASEAYLLLKNNFTSIGRYEGSAWAYVKEQQMEKMEHHWKWCGKGWGIWRARGSLWLWLLKWGYELLTGYGQTPQKPLGVALAFAAILFPLLYWAIGALPGHGAAFSSSSPSDIDWAGWGDSLIFSLTSFGTLSFSRLQPEGTLPNLIAAFEAMIGVLLFALFVFTLGNRMSRS